MPTCSLLRAGPARSERSMNPLSVPLHPVAQRGTRTGNGASPAAAPPAPSSGEPCSPPRPDCPAPPQSALPPSVPHGPAARALLTRSSMQGDAPARSARAAHSNSIGSGSFMRLRSGPDAAHDALAAPPIPPESAQPSWGLQHPNMLQYPPVPMPPLYWEWGDNQLPPVRRMTAAQYADLQARYVALDVPHAVVFPFLHGVDGDNRSQNLFFGAPAEGMPTPNYRGLTLVRADMPRSGECLWASGHDDFSDSCSSSEDIDVPAPKRASVDSLSPSFSPLHRGDRQESFSSASAYTSPPSSRHDSLASTSTSPTSRSSVSSVATPPGTSASQTLRKERAPYEAQPEHSYLTSTVHPTEILGEVGFINPRPPAGVSLRNFRIQCAKYATISDLVIYCPAGLHDGVFGLARRFQRAQDLIYRERLARGLGSLKYNIFVIEGMSPLSRTGSACIFLGGTDKCNQTRSSTLNSSTPLSSQ